MRAAVQPWLGRAWLGWSEPSHHREPSEGKAFSGACCSQAAEVMCPVGTELSYTVNYCFCLSRAYVSHSVGHSL
jgi:hypothetical protein